MRHARTFKTSKEPAGQAGNSEGLGDCRVPGPTNFRSPGPPAEEWDAHSIVDVLLLTMAISGLSREMAFFSECMQKC